jgi:hypothetical protein
LLLAALVLFLASDWRVSLAALLIEYVCVGLLLTRTLQAEVVLVKLTVGALVVAILLLSARHIRRDTAEGAEPIGPHFLGWHLGWLEGPLGFPLRLLALVLVVLALVRLFSDYGLTIVPLDVALVAAWLAATGMLGLVLGSDPVRGAMAVLTVLAGFDLVYSMLERSLAVVGFLSAFYLAAALALAYLITVHGLAAEQTGKKEGGP